jgi:hypothetical protein
MKPKKVVIDKAELKNVESVEIRTAKPASESGYPSGQTHALEIVIRRDATIPSAKGFAIATNQTGKVKYVKGEITLQNPDEKDTYTITLNSAFVESWLLDSPEQREEHDEPVREIWVLRCGRVKVTGVGKPGEFNLTTFPELK